MQYVQLFVTDTASAMISLVRRSTLPGRMIAFSRVQHNSRWGGWVAKALQIAGMKSIFFVSLMSANIFCTNGFGSFSSTSFTVGMGLLLAEISYLWQGRE